MVSHTDPIEENNQDVEEARGRRGSRAEYRDRSARKLKEPAPPKEEPRMGSAEVDGELVRMSILLPFLHQLRLEDLDREFGIYDAAAPVLDPTGWMASHKTVERNRDAVKILLRAQREIRKLFPEQLTAEQAR